MESTKNKKGINNDKNNNKKRTKEREKGTNESKPEELSTTNAQVHKQHFPSGIEQKPVREDGGLGCRKLTRSATTSKSMGLEPKRELRTFPGTNNPWNLGK